MRNRLIRGVGRNLTTLGPLLSGAVAGSMVNHRETRRVGDVVRDDLRRGGPRVVRGSGRRTRSVVSAVSRQPARAASIGGGELVGPAGGHEPVGRRVVRVDHVGADARRHPPADQVVAGRVRLRPAQPSGLLRR